MNIIVAQFFSIEVGKRQARVGESALGLWIRGVQLIEWPARAVAPGRDSASQKGAACFLAGAPARSQKHLDDCPKHRQPTGGSKPARHLIDEAPLGDTSFLEADGDVSEG